MKHLQHKSQVDGQMVRTLYNTSIRWLASLLNEANSKNLVKVATLNLIDAHRRLEVLPSHM